MKLQVLTAHVASYPDPLHVRAGEIVAPAERDTEHPEWIWCVDPRGHGGWTPASFIEERAEGWVCTRDYDSRELAVGEGVLLDRVEERDGWVLCRDASGATGWVPAACLRPSPFSAAPIFALYVRDQGVSADFYRRVFGAPPVLDVPGMTEFALDGGARLGLMPEAGIARLLAGAVDPSAASGAARAELYLFVDDPDAHHARALAAGARELSPLAARDWGDEAAYAQDLDGHVLVFARAR